MQRSQFVYSSAQLHCGFPVIYLRNSACQFAQEVNILALSFILL